MTLCNAWVSRQSALIAVDTQSHGPNGERVHTSKLRSVPHLNAVMSGSGIKTFFHALQVRYESTYLDSFDDLLDATPEMSWFAFDDVLSEAVRNPLLNRTIDIGGISTSLVLVGFSNRQHRMIGYEFLQLAERGRGFVGSEFKYHLSPWGPSLGDPPQSSNPAAAAKIARSQVQWMLEKFPDIPLGGRLILCQLERDKMTITQGPSLSLSARQFSAGEPRPRPDLSHNRMRTAP